MTDHDAMRAARDRWLADPESAGTGKAFEAGWSARGRPRGDWEEVYARGLLLILRHRQSGTVWIQVRASAEVMEREQSVFNVFNLTLHADEARFFGRALVDATTEERR